MILPLCSCLAVGFRRLARACPVTKVAQKLFLKIKKFHTERIAWPGQWNPDFGFHRTWMRCHHDDPISEINRF